MCFWGKHQVVSSQNVKSKSEITDPYVLSYCSSLILQWMEKLNHVDMSLSIPYANRLKNNLPIHSMNLVRMLR